MLLRISFFVAIACTLPSCFVGMLLFYRESTVKQLYKERTSGKDYLVIEANTLSHCGCTHLYATSYRNKKPVFQVFYRSGFANKTIYGEKDTTVLIAVTSPPYTIPFDSTDRKIFSIFDSAIVHGLPYNPSRANYKGYVYDLRSIR